MDKYKPTPKVKSTPDARLILVPHKRAYLLRMRGLQLLLCVLSLAVGGAVGYWYGASGAGDAPKSEVREELLNANRQLQQELTDIQSQAALEIHGSELEKHAVENVRQENLHLQNKVSELEEAVAFYKGIMDPQKDDKGLRIDKINLESTADPQRIRYKLVLTQVADNLSYVSGRVTVKLLGMENGKKTELSLESISEDFDAKGAKFKFRYFQNLSGELLLPKGFMPEQIEIVAQSEGRKAMRLERRFDWKLEEVEHHVGQG